MEKKYKIKIKIWSQNLSICSQYVQNVIQGVVWILKSLPFKLQRHPSSEKQWRERRENGRSLRQPVEETKKKGWGGGSLFFWGKSVGRSEKKNIQALYNPENFENYGQQWWVACLK